LDFKDDYPELAGLAAHHSTIRAEVEELMAKHHNDITAVAEVSKALANEQVFQIKWKSFFLKHGTFIPENAALCPKTAKLLESVHIFTRLFSAFWYPATSLSRTGDTGRDIFHTISESSFPKVTNAGSAFILPSRTTVYIPERTT
jgi:aspartyl/asparaginyl beta-hydroxylase (cupin superfamily)